MPLKSNSWVGVGGPSPPVAELEQRLLLPMEVMTLMPLTVPKPGTLQLLLLLLLLTTELLLPIAFVAGDEETTPIPTPTFSTGFRPNGALQV